MNITKTVITPEVAKTILEKNTKNRPINKVHVANLVNEMKSGRWLINGDTICMNGDTLIDGQHRLTACIEANFSMEAIVVSDLKSDAFVTKDCGRRRSTADVLAVRGEKNYALLSSALIVIDRYITGNLGETRKRYANTQIESLLEKYPDARKSVAFITKIGTKRLIAGSVLAGLHYLFSQIDEIAADEFCQKLISGAGLDEGSPIFLLRERLVSNSLSKAKLKPEYMAALAIKAWNLQRKGKTLRYLRYHEKGNREDFPMIQ